MPGVAYHVSGGGSMTGGPGSSFGFRTVGVAGCGMSSKSKLTRPTYPYPPTHPGTRGRNGLARAVIFGVMLLKKRVVL